MQVGVRNTLGVLALLSCTPGPAATGDEPVEYGTVRIAVAQPPARFGAAWPSSIAALESWYEDDRALPIEHALDGLLAGDPGLVERLRTASLAVTQDERPAWVRQMQQLLAFRSASPEFCVAARPAMDGPPSALREVLAAPFVQDCLTPADRALVLRHDTPAGAVIGYFTRRHDSDDAPLPAWDERLAEAVRTEYSTPVDAYARRRAVFGLTRHPDPRAEGLLLALYREATEVDEKAELGLLLRDAKSAEARAIGAAVCDENPSAGPCERERESRAFAARMRAQGLEVYDAFAALPVDVPEPQAPHGEVRAVRDRLIAAGFDGLRTVDPAGVDGASPIAILERAGYAYSFDVETGQFPNAHDSLMRELAALTGEALADALFEEIPPVYDEASDAESGPYRLSVYLAGKRYRIDAENHGDWYDLDAVLALMNAALADRHSDTRLFVAGTDGQFVVVVGATSDAFRRAVAAGLLRDVDPDAAERVGKAYEDEVLGRMR